jgi:hypothetical protein
MAYVMCFEASGAAYLSAEEFRPAGELKDACAAPARAVRAAGKLRVTREEGARDHCRKAPTRGLVPLSVVCPASAAPAVGSSGEGAGREALCRVGREGRGDLDISFSLREEAGYADPGTFAAAAEPGAPAGEGRDSAGAGADGEGAAPSGEGGAPSGEGGAPPELAAGQQDISFLEGRWESQVNARDAAVGMPPIYSYVFDKDGKAKVTIRDRDAQGRELAPCETEASAYLGGGGRLTVRLGFWGARCPDDAGREYPPLVLGCFPGTDGAPAGCLQFEEGRKPVQAVFRRAPE